MITTFHRKHTGHSAAPDNVTCRSAHFIFTCSSAHDTYPPDQSASGSCTTSTSPNSRVSRVSDLHVRRIPRVPSHSHVSDTVYTSLNLNSYAMLMPMLAFDNEREATSLGNTIEQV